MLIHPSKLLSSLTVLVAFAQFAPTVSAQEIRPAVASDSKASARIDLSSVGFHELSRMDRIVEYQPSLSLDFVDANHLLLTFNRK